MATHQKRDSDQGKEAARKRRTPRQAKQGPVATALEADLAVLQRAVANPDVASSDDILALQRTYGNRAVTGLLAGAPHPIQTKLRVGPAGDQYEQEADRVAEQVVSMPSQTDSQSIQRQEDEEELQMKPLAASITPIVQRQTPEEEEELLQGKPLVQRQTPEEEELLQGKPLVQRMIGPSRFNPIGPAIVDEEERRRQNAEQEEEESQYDVPSPDVLSPVERGTASSAATSPLPQAPVAGRSNEEEEPIQTKPLVQRQLDEDEDLLQGKSLVQRQAVGGFEASDDIARRLAGSKGNGSPLSDDVRADMEASFGTDLSDVRVHTGGEAGELSRALRARAFTHGTDIYLGEGQYDPGSSAGKRLLAHELTHVVQQTGKTVTSDRSVRGHRRKDRKANLGSVPTARVQPQMIQRKVDWEVLPPVLKERFNKEAWDALSERHQQTAFDEARGSTKVGPRPDPEYYKRQQEKHRPPKRQLEALLSGAESIRETQTQGPPKTTTTGPREDPEYYRQQQEKYRPPKGQLEALLRGAQMIREREGQGPPKKTTTGPREDPEYYKQQQEKYRPPKGQLEALLRGAQMIREREKQTSTEGQETDPYHDPMHPTMSPLVNKRPPDRPEKKGPGLFAKIGGFFSKLGRRTKSPESPPSPTPTGKTDEADPYHDPMHPTMSPLVNKRPPDRTQEETDPYHDPMHPTMSPLVNKRPPDRSGQTEPPGQKKPGFFARWRARRKEAKTRKRWGLDKEAWGNMPDVVKKSYMQAQVPKAPKEPKKKSAFRERYGGAWKLWGKTMGQRIKDKLFLPPGMRGRDLDRLKQQEQRGTSPGARKRPGIMERERVSPAKPKEEEKVEKKEETKSTSDEVASLRETIGELKFRIGKLEEERAKT